MKIIPCIQGDVEWLRARIGLVTASELGNLVTPAFELRTGDMVKSYLCSKVAEAYRGEPLPGFSSWASEQGQELEYEARKWVALNTDDEIRNVGFIEHDNGLCGCSPDALIGEDNGLELKCPEAKNHCRYLLEGILPKDYAAQVHGSMYVTGRPRWTFVSYRRSFPKFVLVVERDEEICAKIEEAVQKFSVKLTAALEQLKAA